MANKHANDSIKPLQIMLHRQIYLSSQAPRYFTDPDSLPELAKFSGPEKQGFNRWLSQIQLYMELTGVEPKHWVPFTSLLLEGSACMTWYASKRALEAAGEDVSSFDVFKAHMRHDHRDAQLCKE